MNRTLVAAGVGILVLVFAGFLVFSRGVTRSDELPGRITIRLTSRSTGAAVEVIWDDVRERPKSFPAVISVPLGRIVDMKATHPKFSPYRQELVLHEDQPETVVTVALEEVPLPFTAGFRDSELPSTEQVRFHGELGAVRNDAPEAIFERAGSGCLIVDKDANVWRCRPAERVPKWEPRWERVTKWEYWQVGRVDPAQLGRMVALVKPAQRTGLSEEDACRDCSGYVINARRPAPRIDLLELARDGDVRGVRQNPEARMLVRWILALCRDAPAYDPSRVGARRRPDG